MEGVECLETSGRYKMIVSIFLFCYRRVWVSSLKKLRMRSRVRQILVLGQN